jgi:hypothetical protein
MQPRKKRMFRGEILRMLAVGHAQQQPRKDDTQLALALRDNLWDIDINDVLTIMQEMKGRGWVTFRADRSEFSSRVRLSKIEILPPGVDLYEGTTTDPAVEF